MTTKSNYTPGPWKVIRPQGDDPYGDITVGAENRHVCRLWQDDAPVHDYNAAQRANARLIAASPDLFAFAECSAAIDCASCDPRYDAKPVLRSHGWNGEENPSVFLARIRRNAIEKAVGHYLGRAAA